MAGQTCGEDRELRWKHELRLAAYPGIGLLDRHQPGQHSRMTELGRGHPRQLMPQPLDVAFEADLVGERERRCVHGVEMLIAGAGRALQHGRAPSGGAPVLLAAAAIRDFQHGKAMTRPARDGVAMSLICTP
jgi:hypothetical protein